MRGYLSNINFTVSIYMHKVFIWIFLYIPQKLGFIYYIIHLTNICSGYITKWLTPRIFFLSKLGGDLIQMHKMFEVARFGGFENWLVSTHSRNSIYNVQMTAFASFPITDMHKSAILISPQILFCTYINLGIHFKPKYMYII